MAIPRLGLCSNYLARLNEGDKVGCYLVSRV